MDIVVTGYAGSDGSCIIYHNETCRKKLLTRYSERFFGVFSCSLEPPIFPDPMPEDLAAAYREKGQMQDAADGGVLAALWRLLKAAGTGGTYDLRAIPVLQQTIEVCEMFGLDPYRLYAPSCRVWLAEQPGEILSAAAGAGVPFAVIGSQAKGVGIWRTDTDVPSSLRRPGPDELNRITDPV